jgi:Zn ribbon nucleic-acid-binding protein
MIPLAALVELLGRVGASQGDAVLLSSHQLSLWPDSAVTAMKRQSLLVKARPATSAVCPGCERECSMLVQTQTHPSQGASSFIVCDKRSDVSRVPLPVWLLEQWRCTADAVCGFVAAALGLRRSGKRLSASADVLEIGVATGAKRSQMLCLQTDCDLLLMAGGNKVPLVECVSFGRDAYSVDGAMVQLLVDAATTADNRYTPSNARRETRKLTTQAMYRDWQKAYRDLSKKRKGMSKTWYSQQIAKMPIAKDRNASTIKKNMEI